MNRRSAAVEQTRLNLREAFWELYSEKPVEKITIREITDRAGYNRATFYLHFRDVYDLFEQIEREILNEVRALVNERLLKDDTFDLSRHMGSIVRLAQHHERYLPRLMGPYGDPSFIQQMKVILAPLPDRFILPAEGLSDQERSVLRELYLAGLLGAISSWLAQTERMPTAELVTLIVAALRPRC
ncbi:TetR/AcrR family transcriptional regulator [Collinsella sp. AGMB00827]|uniref:TetR/AcrR family transcriptional regulator n=1 Tax=Collinsella ureilytica TaxID=2869515 RepID=A0ABS7MIJ3_9ACTN|nr:TetR/AcrR family transcriptional regulator [Collinsella urealyticum]MBY4796915.1 TetR/AcrR family transcriptional regulator [Collinsella urealyticum]